ncbi:LPP20 family lipoprotein [Candidatus Puniceispirillum sp.]|nr:LPP20 family lipoprotein [Candidatus Puniceispirillum sp.]
MNKVFSTAMSMVIGLVLLTGCQHVTKEPVVMDKIASLEASQTQTLVNIKDVFDAGAENIPTLTAVGYAVTSTQPGRNEAQKRLMAIRSARMAAMRDLAEQIHGLKVDSSTTVIDLIVQNDTFRGMVNGTIRGARTVRINPTGTDTYEVVLEIDRETIGYLLTTARKTA